MTNYGNYPDLSQVRRILVIKLRHHGDVLLTSPVFSVFKSRFPQSEISAYIYKETFPILEGHPAIAGFHLYDRDWKSLSFWQRAVEETRLMREIKKQRYDLVINLTEGDRGAFVALLSNAGVRIGVKPEEQGKYKQKIFTHLVKHCKHPRHTVEQNLDALRRIGIFPSYKERDLFFHIPDSARRTILKYLREAGFQEGSYILIHPTSRWMFKCWPADKVVRLIHRLNKEGYPLVISSSPDPKELSMIEQILPLCHDISLLNIAGKLSLKEFGALIESSACLICVDSLPVHIASALKTPVAAIFGPSSEDAWGPWKNPGGRVIAENISCRPCNLDGCGGGKVCDCLEQLPVDRVFDEIKRVVSLTA
ncbi:putative lipopolysaccharide heptosyltransferase III [Desulfobacterales bacterium HSG2]|nr:putative lipopolysaccharide heptosyltransferase III [Desulfobacterales bacterium HSG2]